MIATSTRFLLALRESHTISVAAFLYRPSAPTIPIEVQVVGGSVTMDADARTRRQASLVVGFALTDEDTPGLVRELPFGGQAVLERGIRYADGSTERVQLGRFRVEAVNWSELEGEATLTLADRMAQIADEPFLTPWVPTGQKPSDAAAAAVYDVFGNTIAYHVETDPASEPALADTVYDEDRAAAVASLAASVGAEAFFNQLGDFVIRPHPPGTGEPVWTVDAGERGVMIGAEESLDRSSVRNGVAVRGQPAADVAPIFALATDDDPASPTRWGGPFGKVALISSSSAVSSQAQADATAASLLQLRLGLSRTLAIRGLPNPALVPGDLLAIEHADGRTELQLVNALSLELDTGGALTISTRANWRPEVGLQPAKVRLWAGPSAWRELEDAAVSV